MKGARIALALVVLYIMTFCIARVAFCREVSLTTTIFITVKANPKSNLAPNDKNADTVNKLAKSQLMANPYIKAEPYMEEMVPDVKFSGEKIYTIVDTL